MNRVDLESNTCLVFPCNFALDFILGHAVPE